MHHGQHFDSQPSSGEESPKSRSTHTHANRGTDESVDNQADQLFRHFESQILVRPSELKRVLEDLISVKS